jgi:hypothetical protein
MKYRTIAGELADMHPSITPERIINAVERCMTTLDDPGFCLHCGTDADGCEPDAQHYKCDSCGFLRRLRRRRGAADDRLTPCAPLAGRLRRHPPIARETKSLEAKRSAGCAPAGFSRRRRAAGN